MLVKIQDGPVMLERISQVTYTHNIFKTCTKFVMKKLSLLKLGNLPTNKVCTFYSYTAVTQPSSSAQNPPSKVGERHKRLLYKDPSSIKMHTRQERHKYGMLGRYFHLLLEMLRGLKVT